MAQGRRCAHLQQGREASTASPKPAQLPVRIVTSAKDLVCASLADTRARLDAVPKRRPVDLWTLYTCLTPAADHGEWLAVLFGSVPRDLAPLASALRVLGNAKPAGALQLLLIVGPRLTRGLPVRPDDLNMLAGIALVTREPTVGNGLRWRVVPGVLDQMAGSCARPCAPGRRRSGTSSASRSVSMCIARQLAPTRHAAKCLGSTAGTDRGGRGGQPRPRTGNDPTRGMRATDRLGRKAISCQSHELLPGAGQERSARGSPMPLRPPQA